MDEADDNLTPRWPSNNPPIDEVWPTIAEVQAEPGVSPDEALLQLEQFVEKAGRHETLLASLADLHDSGPDDLRKTTTVFTLMQSLLPAPPKTIALILELLPPTYAKFHDDTLRGMLATIPAAMHAIEPRRSKSELSTLKSDWDAWLAYEIKTRSLGFEVSNVWRWFYDCRDKNVHVTNATMAVFNSYNLPPALTEAAAKQYATGVLDTVVALKPRPLVRTKPRRSQ